MAVVDQGQVVGQIDLAQPLHATRRDIHEDEHRERFLYLSVLAARARGGGAGRGG